MGTDVEMGFCTEELSLGNQKRTKWFKGNQLEVAEEGTFSISMCIFRVSRITLYAHHDKHRGPKGFRSLATLTLILSPALGKGGITSAPNAHSTQTRRMVVSEEYLLFIIFAIYYL